MSAAGRAKGEPRKPAAAEGHAAAPADGHGDAATARYAIGIDLGTTHSALSWVDVGASDG